MSNKEDGVEGLFSDSSRRGRKRSSCSQRGGSSNSLSKTDLTLELLCEPYLFINSSYINNRHSLGLSC